MKGSRVASRIVIAAILLVVFGTGVSMIVLPGMLGAQSRVAINAPAAAGSRAPSDLPAPETSATATRDAAAGVAPPGVASPGAPASDTQPASNTHLAENSGSGQGSASGNDPNASTPKRE